MMRAIVLLILALAVPAFAADPDSAEAERATFKIADGFDVNLFASEVDGVVKPIQMRFDARGRIWIVGSAMYPQIEPGQTPSDKVIILEDTDHDGRSDKTTVFADGLTIPTGIELGDGGSYVGQGTQLLHLKDTNGDGKSDVRTVVLRGFGTGDSHQNINSFAWDDAGDLWMCQGLSIRSRVETPWGIVSLNQAGLWRLNPRRMKLDGFYGSQNEPQNPWGYAFTQWGEPISIAGNYSSHFYPVPGLVPSREDSKIEPIWKAGAGRKCSGGDFVGTSHFPKSWQGALILGGYLNNAVWALKLSDNGAGFSLEDRPEPLIKSSSTSFRPVDVKFGPDGALYVCDWYNPIIGHYQNSFWDPKRDRVHGRIWRVTAKGRPLTAPPKLAGASTTELFNQLKSEDRWTRHFAKRVLAEMSTKEVTTDLRKWWKQPGLSDLTLKEALGVFQGHEVVEPELLTRLCEASDPGARAYAASVVGKWADRLPDPLSMLRRLIIDEHPRVRLQALVSCAYVPKAESIEIAMMAADSQTDVFIDYAINQVVCSLKPQWVDAFKSGALRFENKPARIAALVKSDGTPDTLDALRKLVASPDLDATARESFLRILADIGDANDLAIIVQLSDPAVQARLLPVVAEAARLRNLKPAGDLVAMANALLAKPDEQVGVGALGLVDAWKLTAMRPAVEKIAQDPRESTAKRQAAIAALPAVAAGDAWGILIALCDSATDSALHASAIAALAELDMPAAADVAADFLLTPAPDSAVESLIGALLKRDDAAPALAKSFAAKKPSADAAKIALRIMSASGQRDETLAGVLEAAAGMNREPVQVTDAEIAAIAAEARAQGDASRGAKIFARPEMSCATCHAIAGQGGKIGPDLGSLGTAQTMEAIVGSVLLPNREVKEGFAAHQILTKTGDRYTAYIVRENPQEMVIRDIATNKEFRLRPDTIAKRRELGSPMPQGLTNTLTRAELRDLIKYLASLGQAVGTN